MAVVRGCMVMADPFVDSSFFLLDDTEFALKIEGVRGGFMVDLSGAKINGKAGSTLANRKRLLEAWRGVRLGGRWVPSPTHDTPKPSSS